MTSPTTAYLTKADRGYAFYVDYVLCIVERIVDISFFIFTYFIFISLLFLTLFVIFASIRSANLEFWRSSQSLIEFFEGF